MNVAKSWLLTVALIAPGLGCRTDGGVDTAGNPGWCSGAQGCTDLVVTGLWTPGSSVAGQHLCLKINYEDSKIGFYRVAMPASPTLTLQVPKAGDGSPELKSLWVQAVSDDRSSGDEDICGKPACVSAEVKLNVGPVTGTPPTVVAALEGKKADVKVNVTPEQVGNVTWRPAGVDLVCRYPADKDRGNCVAQVAACTALSLRAGDLQGQGTFAGWSMGSDVGCGSNDNPYKLVAGQRPGSSAEGVRLKEFCDASTATASFLPGRCGPNSGSGGKCNLCNPLDALDPGAGTYACNNQGQWECQSVQRKTVVLKGDDLFLQHDCGNAGGDGSWGLVFGAESHDCYMQKGPAMTLPPGRYSVTVNYLVSDSSNYRNCESATRFSRSLEVTNLSSGEKKTTITGGATACTKDKNGYYYNLTGSLSTGFVIPAGCQRMNFDFHAKISASMSSYDYGILKILNTTITPL